MPKQKTTKRTVLSFPVAPELKAEIDRLAEVDSRSTADYVRLVLKQHISDVASGKRPPQALVATTAEATA